MEPVTGRPAPEKPGISSGLDLSGCIILAGPTAVGKSGIALKLAERLGGEILSVDSMQVYRGLDIGTAKPSLAERRQIPHHLIDVVGLNEEFNAARFLARATEALGEIRRRGRLPILCGGTGFYFQALLAGVGEAPPADPVLREELAAVPLPVLLRELAEQDPVAYERIDRQNPRRVIRAIEVLRLTGTPFSQYHDRQTEATTAKSTAPWSFALNREPKDLHARIERRVESMFRDDLVEETRNLLLKGLAENRTALQALGYRQIEEYLRGARALPATIELVKLRTRQFAKRQLTWFRRQMELTWIELTAGQSPSAAVETLAQALRSKTK